VSERRRIGRSDSPWLTSVGLLVALLGLAYSGWRSDMIYDDGPLSLQRASVVSFPLRNAADAATLKRCFERIDPRLWYRIARDASSASAAAACYREPDGAGPSARVLDARGRRANDVAVLRRAGVWRWADPMSDMRWVGVLAAAALVALQAAHARLVSPEEAAVRTSGGTRVLICTPVFGLMYLPWLQGVSRARRRTLMLRHLVVYPSLACYAVFAAGLESGAMTADLFVAILPGAIGLVALRARRGSWPRWGKAWEAPVRWARWLRTRSRWSRLRGDLGRTVGFLRVLGAMFLEWVNPRRGVPVGRRPSTSGGSSPFGDVIQVDVSRLAAATRSVHRLVFGLKVAAVLLSVWFLFPGGDDTRFELTWQRVVTAILAFSAMAAVVIGAQEQRVHVVAAYALTWAAFAAAAAIAVALRTMTPSDAVFACAGAGYLGIPILWWRLQRRRLGISADEAQAVLRVGQVPLNFRPSVGRLRPYSVVRIVLATPLLVAGVTLSTANAVLGVPGLADAAQALFDRVYGLGRRLAGPALAELVPPEQKLALSYVRSQEPGMWTSPVRGNLVKYGSWGPQLLAFDEFVIDRLAVEGIRATSAPIAWKQVLVAIPVGPPLADQDLARVDVAFRATSYLMLFAPASQAVLRAAWTSLQQRLRAADEVHLVSLDESILAVLVTATHPARLYVASQRDQWQYMSVIHRAAARAAGHPYGHDDPNSDRG
jgi:hypothetical protein